MTFNGEIIPMESHTWNCWRKFCHAWYESIIKREVFFVFLGARHAARPKHFWSEICG